MQHKSPGPPKDYIDYHLLDQWITTHPVAPLRAWLKRRGFLAASDLARVEGNARVRVAGMLVMTHTPPTRSGRRVMFITLEDETGLIDLVAFEDVQKRWARAFLVSDLLLVEGTLKKEGPSQGSISIVIRRLLPMDGP